MPHIRLKPTSPTLYEASPPPEAQRIHSKLDRFLASKHGSRLTVAELGLAELFYQCLDQQRPDADSSY